MSYKTNNSSSKIICERCIKHNCVYSCKTDKSRCRPVKKVIPSRKLELASSSEVKSCSTGGINYVKKPQVPKTRKITKSDMCFDSKKSVTDFCTKCGDSKINNNGSCKSFNSKTLENLCKDVETQVYIDQKRRKKVCDKKKIVHEYYKNENFKRASYSYLNNSLLDPIKEGTEGPGTVENSSKSILEIHSDSVEEMGFLDPKDDKIIKNIKDFREKNYFECHSAKARVTSKGSVTSLIDHECVYRFYLNDRLFPAPLNADHKRIIRCIDCHLPLELDSNSDDSERINGTIQAKVRIGNEIQDLTLMLPVRNPLIIQEKRIVENEKENDVLYFGIVKLNYNGDSIFNSTLPHDSLALRYQKGYKELDNNVRFQYEKIREDDIIII